MDAIIKTGIDSLDKMISEKGSHRGSLTVVTARKAGMGKNALALQIAGNIVKNGKYTLFFSLELGKENADCIWNNQGLTADNRPNIFVDMFSYDIDFIETAIKLFNKTDVVVIDNIEKLNCEVDRADSCLYQKVMKNTEVLKNLAKEYGISIIVTSRTIRPPVGFEDRKPAFMKDADLVICPCLFSDNGTHKHNDGDGIIRVIKNNFGSVGTVPINFDGQRLTFKSSSPRKPNDD